MEWNYKEFTLSDDQDKVDVDVVADLLGETYWGHRRPPNIVRTLIENSLCFSLFRGQEQVGFARVVTDYTVFSWLSDMVITPSLQGQGLGKWVMSCVLNHPTISRTQFVLQTRTAQRFYEEFGFRPRPQFMTSMW